MVRAQAEGSQDISQDGRNGAPKAPKRLLASATRKAPRDCTSAGGSAGLHAVEVIALLATFTAAGCPPLRGNRGLAARVVLARLVPLKGKAARLKALVTVTSAENSDVSFAGDVAVVEMALPAVTPTANLTRNVALPVTSVVTIVDPR